MALSMRLAAALSMRLELGHLPLCLEHLIRLRAPLELRQLASGSVDGPAAGPGSGAHGSPPAAA